MYKSLVRLVWGLGRSVIFNLGRSREPWAEGLGLRVSKWIISVSSLGIWGSGFGGFCRLQTALPEAPAHDGKRLSSETQATGGFAYHCKPSTSEL